MKNLEEIRRVLLKKIQQDAPKAYQNHSIFEEFKEKLDNYVSNNSTYCKQVTRHIPIVPYAHLNRDGGAWGEGEGGLAFCEDDI